jgi:hypothetical protein
MMANESTKKFDYGVSNHERVACAFDKTMKVRNTLGKAEGDIIWKTARLSQTASNRARPPELAVVLRTIFTQAQLQNALEKSV